MPRVVRVGILSLGLMIATGFSVVRAEDVVHRCFGRVATMVGTNGPDSLGGTEGPDVIVGLGGNDFIRGFRGDDRICGGPGDDSADFPGGTDAPGLEGSEGNDMIQGGPGFDDVNGGPVPVGSSAGHDKLYGGRGPDFICDNWCFRGFGEGETSTGPDDRLFGGRGVDDLIDTQGGDYSEGGPGSDELGLGSVESSAPMTPLGRDVYLGSGGDDSIDAPDGVQGNDSLDGGSHNQGDSCQADVGDSITNCDP